LAAHVGGGGAGAADGVGAVDSQQLKVEREQQFGRVTVRPEIRQLWLRMKSLVQRRQLDRDIEDEVAFHLAMREKKNREAGLPPEEARYAARRQFGNTSIVKERNREMWTLGSLETLWRDFTYALRTLTKKPGFALVAIVTLALGIGASTAIFSVIESILIEPFAYPDARRMMTVEIHDAGHPDGAGRAEYPSPEFLDYVEKNHVFDSVIANASLEVLYSQGEGVERFHGVLCTPGTFEFLGMPAALGRVLQPADYEPGAPPAFVLRYKTWVASFAADPAVVNKTFILNGVPRTLVGVMPPRFGWGAGDVYIPEKPSRAEAHAVGDFPIVWYLIGHLKPGVSSAQAQADLTVVANQLAKTYPRSYPPRFTVKIVSITDMVVGTFRSTLYLMLAAVVLLLLIGCSNVANLLLARATAREKEFAVRAVLGASRWRMVRQLLVESLILALIGGALGVALAWSGLQTLVSLVPPDVIASETVIRLNGPALLFALAVAVATALLFGLVPALQTAGRDLNDPLRATSRGASSSLRHGRFRNAVVVLEVAMSLTLLVGAGLLMRSFVTLRQAHLGFQPDHILTARLPLPQERYHTAAQVARFFRPLLARLKAIPGVIDAAETSTLPPYGGIPTDIEVLGKTHAQKWEAVFELLSEEYSRVLKVPFLEGRPFTEAEVDSARRVAVINRTFAQRYLTGQNPIGQRIRINDLENFPDPVSDPWFEVVGVIGDIMNDGVHRPIRPEVWVPYTVTGSAARGILVRTAGDPLALLGAVRKEIWATDRGVAIALTGALEDYINSYDFSAPRFTFLLTTIFAAVGLILAITGVYSVVAYTTARRTHEIGIRIALGADRYSAIKLVLRMGMRLIAIGVAVGMAISLAASGALAGELWQVSAHDPLTIAGVCVLLLATGLVACWVPARRAARIEPVVALRSE
jgi:putative ABC transport system permease protein